MAPTAVNNRPVEAHGLAPKLESFKTADVCRVSRTAQCVNSGKHCPIGMCAFMHGPCSGPVYHICSVTFTVSTLHDGAWLTEKRRGQGLVKAQQASRGSGVLLQITHV